MHRTKAIGKKRAVVVALDLGQAASKTSRFLPLSGIGSGSHGGAFFCAFSLCDPVRHGQWSPQ
jgi:hypothetical protein